MEEMKWIKMSDKEPSVEGWDIQVFAGITKDGRYVLFAGGNDEAADGHVYEHFWYLYKDDDYFVDFDDIEAWIELPYYN